MRHGFDFLAAGFFALFAAGFLPFLPRAARFGGGGASSISSSAGSSSSSGGGTSGVGSGSGVAGRLALGVARFVFLGFGFSSTISSSNGAGVGRSRAWAWNASTASCVKDDGKGTEGGFARPPKPLAVSIHCFLGSVASVQVWGHLT